MNEVSLTPVNERRDSLDWWLKHDVSQRSITAAVPEHTSTCYRYNGNNSNKNNNSNNNIYKIIMVIIILTGQSQKRYAKTYALG